MKMYRYIVHDSITSRKEFFKSSFEFSQLLVRELMKELSPTKAIFSTFPVEMHN